MGHESGQVRPVTRRSPVALAFRTGREAPRAADDEVCVSEAAVHDGRAHAASVKAKVRKATRSELRMRRFYRTSGPDQLRSRALGVARQPARAMMDHAWI